MAVQKSKIGQILRILRYSDIVQPTLLKSIRFCFIDVRWLLTAFDFQILKTTTCTLSYKTLKILSTFCSLVWKIRENLKILFSKIWPDRTDSCNIMCIWVKSPGEFKNLDLSKVNEHRTSSSLLESLKLSCMIFFLHHDSYPDYLVIYGLMGGESNFLR